MQLNSDPQKKNYDKKTFFHEEFKIWKLNFCIECSVSNERRKFYCGKTLMIYESFPINKYISYISETHNFTWQFLYMTLIRSNCWKIIRAFRYVFVFAKCFREIYGNLMILFSSLQIIHIWKFKHNKCAWKTQILCEKFTRKARNVLTGKALKLHFNNSNTTRKIQFKTTLKLLTYIQQKLYMHQWLRKI